ncbi:hypothetical protein EHQ76_07910 [Leptospira barantonii]|uniref:DUF4340 domain-containing protein n=1 Tax=Leptospira barantonii TaxID=2023184 RepID=A0A5F2BGJ6_9LEPT|nr:DUF4340 domain-containing protein [Leptospira barantonii]TGM04659.1 hypothetical protein EHQ76_07910 [Leptospira barantonii]
MKIFERFYGFLLGLFRDETALFLILCNLFLGAIYFSVSNPFGFFQKNYQNADPFFPFKTEEVERIQIGRKGHETVLQRIGETWSVRIRETQARPDVKKIVSFLNSILRIRKFTKISSSSDASDFGLNGEELKLEIQSSSGEIGRLDIGVGDRASSGTFVRIPATGEVWLVEEDLNLLSGRGNETFFFSGFLLPEETSIQEIHTILIQSIGEKNLRLEIEQDSPGRWRPIVVNPILCPGEDCSEIVSKILSLKAERILKKPFQEKSIPLSHKDRFQIEIRFASGRDEPLHLEWIGNTSGKEPIFRVDSEPILYVIDPNFLKDFEDTRRLREFFRESSDPF